MLAAVVTRVRRRVKAIASERASPGQLAAACVVGAVIGCTPFYGLHFPICMGAALALRLNRAAVYTAANISIPPLAPFVALACIEVGSRVLTGHGAMLTAASLRTAHPFTLARHVFLFWLLGAPLVGVPVGVLLGGIVFFAAKAHASAKKVSASPFEFAVGELRRRFHQAPIGVRQYVRWKVRLDPVYRAIAAELPDAIKVVELGAGLGILPILLALLGSRRTVLGVDHDEVKVREGVRAAVGLPVELLVADVRTWSPPPCDALAIIDVLHYFDAETQRTILARAANAIREDGVLLIREGDPSHRTGRWTRSLESLAVRVGWNMSERAPHFRSLALVSDDLRALGFEVESRDVAGKLHPGNVLLIARRAPAEEP
ncbi:MAG: hypothetical protein NVS3B20_06560 [Polyangiales bacterium]